MGSVISNFQRLFTCLVVVSFINYLPLFQNGQIKLSECHDVRGYYSEFYEDEKGLLLAALNHQSQQFSKNRVIHNAKFGLGHRLSKISNAWHLAKSLNVTRLELQWKDCQGIANIFPRLFGSEYIDVTGVNGTENHNSNNNSKSILISNDVSGYYAASTYKSHQVPFSAKVYKGENSPWLNKLDSDLELCKILRQRFVGKKDVNRFMEKHDFLGHFVVGLHLRLGNSEPGHFATSERGGSGEQEEFVQNMLDLLRYFLESVQKSHPERFTNCKQSLPKKKPLIFLATDTPKFIPFIVTYTRLWGVQTVVMEQMRLDEGTTWYKLKKGEECLQGWHEMILDTMLLSSSDVLISPKYSTFAQILPLPLVFDHGGVLGPHFCEMSESARAMTCLEDKNTWLWRDNEEKMFHYSLLNEDKLDLPVVHALTTHLPDVELSPHYADAKNFIEKEDVGTLTNISYGAEFDPKYRWEVACPDCTDFTFSEN